MTNEKDKSESLFIEQINEWANIFDIPISAIGTKLGEVSFGKSPEIPIFVTDPGSIPSAELFHSLPYMNPPQSHWIGTQAQIKRKFCVVWFRTMDAIIFSLASSAYGKDLNEIRSGMPRFG